MRNERLGELVVGKLRSLQSQGWTIPAIAEEVGVECTTVSRWVNGHSAPKKPREVLQALEGLIGKGHVSHVRIK